MASPFPVANMLKRGVQSGIFGVRSTPLAQFIRCRCGLSRETESRGRDWLANGFRLN